MNGWHLESGAAQTFNGNQFTSGRILSPNPKRRSIAFSGNAAQAGGWIHVLPTDAPATSQFGYELSAGRPVFVARYEDMGPIIQQGWSVIFGLAANSITIIETFLAEGD